MTSIQHHIIRRQILDIKIAGTDADGNALQRRAAEFCNGWLTPALEAALARSVPDDEHWAIDRLEVDAGSIALETFERDLVEAVTQGIERQLAERAVGGPLDWLPRGAETPVEPRPMEGSPRQPGLLGSMGSSGTIQRRTDAQSIHEAFLHFLATGILPWWFHLPTGKTLEDTVLASWQTSGKPPDFDRSLTIAIAADGARKRLIRQFSTDFLETMLASFARAYVRAVREVLAEVEGYHLPPATSGRLSAQLWQAAFTAIGLGRRPTAQSVVAEWIQALPADGGWPESRLIELIVQSWLGAESQTNEAGEAMPRERTQSRVTRAEEKMLRDGTKSRDMPAEERIPLRNSSAAARHDEPTSRIDLEEGVYVECAGLVLLHPFLPRLFEALGITSEDRLVQPDRALCLLHFLATGERRAPEYALILPKLLCDLPLDAPVEEPVALTAADEEEAIALLEAVIRHWDALGNASVDALRGTFLARPGKFSRRGNGDDVLQVEPQSFDILLDRLPWGIGMIQLPWMEKLLWVEWRF